MQKAGAIGRVSKETRPATLFKRPEPKIQLWEQRFRLKDEHLVGPS
jgi:hypothetical protein